MGNYRRPDILLSDHQVEKVLICFLKEVFSGNLRSIDQKGWDNFEGLRVSANARLRWGMDMCVQMLQNANQNIKNFSNPQQPKEKTALKDSELNSSTISSGKLP